MLVECLVCVCVNLMCVCCVKGCVSPVELCVVEEVVDTLQGGKVGILLLL